MPDREIEKISPSGVTVGGETLERYLKTEESDELLETVKPEKHDVSLYHSPRIKFRIVNGKGHSHVKSLTRREINAQFGERLLMEITNMDEAIMQVLLSGDRESGIIIRDKVIKIVPGKSKKDYDSRMSYFIRKTDLKHLIEVVRQGHYNTYDLVDAAKGLSPKELLVFSRKDKGSLRIRANLLSLHEGLKIYFQPSDEPTIPTGTGSDTDGQGQDMPTATGIEAALSKAIGKALGIKVEVLGRIEIVFKLGD